MAVTLITGTTMTAGIKYTARTNSSVDWTGVTSGTTFFDLATEKVYYKDGSNNVGLFDSSGGATGGKVAIYNSGGTPTFYSTFGAAMSASTTGDTVHLLTNIIENTTIYLKDGVDINGNGFSVTNNANDTTNVIQKLNIAVSCTIRDIKFLKTSGTGSAFIINDTGTSTINTHNVYTHSIDGVGLRIGSACTFNGNKTSSFNSTTSYGCESYGVETRGVNSTTGNYIAFRNFGGDMFDCTGKSNTLAGLSNEGTGTAYNCTGVSVSGKGLGYTVSSNVYVNCVGISGTGIALSLGTFINCYGKSSSGVGAQSSVCENVDLESAGNFAAAYCILRNSTLRASASATVEADGSSPIVGNVVICSYNNSAGHGIGGAVSGVTISNNYIQVANASAYGISVTTASYTNNTIKGATVAINPSTTQLVTNTQDSQGNILI